MHALWFFSGSPVFHVQLGLLGAMLMRCRNRLRICHLPLGTGKTRPNVCPPERKNALPD